MMTDSVSTVINVKPLDKYSEIIVHDKKIKI